MRLSKNQSFAYLAHFNLGIALTGTAGGAPPGLLLIAVGADQVYTGIANILTGQKDRSLFEEAGYNLTLRMGFSESTAGVVGQLTPGLLSLGAGIWGGFATSAARAGGGVAGMPRFDGWSDGVRQLLGRP